MTDTPLLLAFLAAAIVLTITPGVDTAMVLRSAAVDGRRTAAFASIGIASGCLIWAAAVSLGLGALIEASELGYTIVKCAGAAYLAWLGVRLLLNPREVLGESADHFARSGGSQALLRGFLTNLLNPKVGVFYITFLPQFIPAGADVAVQTFGLACIHVILTLGWFAALIAATQRFGPALRNAATIRTLDRLTGCIFILFAFKLAISSNR